MDYERAEAGGTTFYEALLLTIALFFIAIGIIVLGSAFCSYYDECFNFPTADQKILLRALNIRQKENKIEDRESETEFLAENEV